MSKLIDRFETEKITLKDFCLREGVSKSTFEYWRRNLKSNSLKGSRRAPVFQEILPVAPKSSDQIRISSPKGLTLELPADYSPKDLLKILRGLSC